VRPLAPVTGARQFPGHMGATGTAPAHGRGADDAGFGQHWSGNPIDRPKGPITVAPGFDLPVRPECYFILNLF
jgi:hypothetical protein